MNVAVLVLPLVQLWVSTRKVLNALRLKAVAFILTRLGCSGPAAEDPLDAEGDAQVCSLWPAPISRSASLRRIGALFIVCKS
jgi:hypothetical protein